MHMMKLLTLAFLIVSFDTFANCPEQKDLDIRTSIDVKGVKAGGNHGFMDVVTISAPSSIDGIPFKSIELTYGEVSEYWIPLATTLKNDRFVATISGYSDSINQFEFWVNYSDGKCALYQAGSIGSAYNKLLKQDS